LLKAKAFKTGRISELMSEQARCTEGGETGKTRRPPRTELSGCMAFASEKKRGLTGVIIQAKKPAENGGKRWEKR